jgi:hypothetical protein
MRRQSANKQRSVSLKALNFIRVGVVAGLPMVKKPHSTIVRELVIHPFNQAGKAVVGQMEMKRAWHRERSRSEFSGEEVAERCMA